MYAETEPKNMAQVLVLEPVKKGEGEPRATYEREEACDNDVLIAGKHKLEAQAWALNRISELENSMRLDGKAEKSIKTFRSMLVTMMRAGADLQDPESVKKVIAHLKLRNGSEPSPNTKRQCEVAYNAFAKQFGITWKPPKYRNRSRIPFIPKEREIDDLIAGCSKNTSALLQFLKETGARQGEALEVKWIDLDVEHRIVRIQEPEKGSNPRAIRVSDQLIGMLNGLKKDDVKIFGGRARYPAYYESFKRSRRKASDTLQNPRLLQIHFHTLRHWKATMEYHRTKDPWHVKQMLGHKSLQNTEIYINLEQTIFENRNDDDFNIKVATKADSQKIQELMKTGFEYHCQNDELMFFRKRN